MINKTLGVSVHTSLTSSSESFPSPFLSHLITNFTIFYLEHKKRSTKIKSKERLVISLHVKKYLQSCFNVFISHILPKHSQFIFSYTIFCRYLSTPSQSIKELSCKILWFPSHSYKNPFSISSQTPQYTYNIYQNENKIKIYRDKNFYF